jgi:hypothetical protein
MRKNSLVVVMLGVCITSFAGSGDDRCASSVEAVPLCTVLSDAAKYDGQEITVRGLYRMVLHGSVLMSPACGKIYVNVRQASDYRANKHALGIMRSLTKKDQFQSVDIVFRGTFRVAPRGQCFGQNCLSYQLEDHELLCAEPPGPDANTTKNHETGHAQGPSPEK